MDMQNRLNKYAKKLLEDLKKEDNEDVAKDLTSDNKIYLQIEKDLAAYDKMHALSSKQAEKGDLYFTGMGKLTNKIDEWVGKLVKEVEQAVARDKNRNKNEKSQTYRYLKVFIADINSLAPTIAQQVKFELEQQKAAKEDMRKGVKEAESKARSILTALRQMGTNLEAGIAHTARFCKTVNATPTVTEWNKINTDYGIRKVSQPLTNLVKYCFTSLQELENLTNTRKSEVKEVDIAMNPAVFQQIKKLQQFLKDDAIKIKELGGVSGKNAFDGSIGFLGDKKEAHLDNAATEEDVRKAVRHVHDLLKQVVPIAEKLKKFDA